MPAAVARPSSSPAASLEQDTTPTSPSDPSAPVPAVLLPPASPPPALAVPTPVPPAPPTIPAFAIPLVPATAVPNPGFAILAAPPPNPASTSPPTSVTAAPPLPAPAGPAASPQPPASAAALPAQVPLAPADPAPVVVQAPSASAADALASPASLLHVTAGTLPPYPAVQAHAAHSELPAVPAAEQTPMADPVPAGVSAQCRCLSAAPLALAPGRPSSPSRPVPAPRRLNRWLQPLPCLPPLQPSLPLAPPLSAGAAATPAQLTSSQRMHAAVQPPTSPPLAMAPPQQIPAASMPLLLPPATQGSSPADEAAPPPPVVAFPLLPPPLATAAPGQAVPSPPQPPASELLHGAAPPPTATTDGPSFPSTTAVAAPSPVSAAPPPPALPGPHATAIMTPNADLYASAATSCTSAACLPASAAASRSEQSSTASRPHLLEHPTPFSPSTLPAPSGTTLYHDSCAQPHPCTQTVQRGGGGWNMTAALINPGQTENYFAPGNVNPLMGSQKNFEKEPFPNSSKVPPVFGTDFSTQNETLNPENPLALIQKLENSQKSFDNFQLTDWHEVRRQICKEESLNPLAMPVLFSQQAGGPRTWVAIPPHEIKELRKAIRDSGICSPYFKQLLKSTLEGHTLTPNDCKNLASIILTDSQYMLWELKWKRLLTGVLATYRQSTDADLRTLVMSKLTGDPPDDQNDNQVNLPKTALDDIKKMARRAFLQIQPAGSFEKAYNLISQELSEPFTTFVDRVIQAAERQCGDDIARPIMIRDIVENNANAECKRVIKALGKEKPTVPEMIDACNKIGSPQQVATIQANELGKTLGEKIERALTAQTAQAAAQAAQAEARDQKLTEILAALHLNSRQQGNTMAVMQAAVTSGPCNFCKQPGHFRRNCPEVKRGAQALSYCSACKKGA
ncbi:LOW QUALITY PROTEIN: proteoglycan 4-like [Serinus canaria]|uniref:LOW QUALITY PROTEIN: proteoglycan 4-like n=1 Tax=Serinus canaria TaxID=9135 RepID=UPI0021CC4FCD|nr:LOW QUALITY PROTEIN: proteoglycan 4-like [Serinus canaria]